MDLVTGASRGHEAGVKLHRIVLYKRRYGSCHEIDLNQILKSFSVQCPIFTQSPFREFLISSRTRDWGGRASAQTHEMKAVAVT